MNTFGQLVLVAVGMLALAMAYLASLAIFKLVFQRGAKLIEKGRKSFIFEKIQLAITHTFAKNTNFRQFLSARLTTEKFSGLPLTLMVFAASYIFGLASEFLIDLLQADELVMIDQAINRILEPARGWPLIDVFAWITVFGNTQTVMAVCIVTSAFLSAFNKASNILPLWITILGSTITTWTGKYVIGRARPEPLDGFLSLSPSFPSGHATIATAVYGFLAYLIVRDIKKLRIRFEVVFWTTIVVGLIGFSRIYLRFHYTSDVITGFLVGGFWLLVGFMIVEYRRMALPD
ncbi:MAG: membrane-associated phospholipid phosphatase [Gammaproteobacteria bacterium]|jgi:membrane-associated phospholipid phosphatase